MKKVAELFPSTGEGGPVQFDRTDSVSEMIGCVFLGIWGVRLVSGKQALNGGKKEIAIAE